MTTSDLCPSCETEVASLSCNQPALATSTDDSSMNSSLLAGCHCLCHPEAKANLDSPACQSDPGIGHLRLRLDHNFRAPRITILRCMQPACLTHTYTTLCADVQAPRFVQRCLLVHLSISTCLSVCPSINQLVHSSVNRSTNPSARVSASGGDVTTCRAAAGRR